MEKSNDFVAAMELQHTVGSRADWYGIVFRISGGNFYCFEVDESGVFGAWLFYQDEYKSLISGNRVYLIKPGEINQVAIKAVGSKFSFYINQQLVGEAEDDTLPIGYVGMILHPSGNPQDSAGTAGPNSSSQNELEWQQSVFEIENFKIWVPKGSKQAGSISLSLLNPEPGYLVYMSSRDGNTEIYSSDTKGKNPVRLTNDPAEDYSPRWSPDGKQIVFVSERDGNPEIYVMNRDGSGLTRLTDDSADDLDPSWSPDGKKIVFSSERGGYKIFKIYVLDIETKSVERITNGHLDVFPEWSPDGNLIIFQSTREHSQDFYIIDVKTKKENRITFKTYTSVARPAWSPDGLSYVHETILSDDQIGITISDYPNTQIEVVVDTVNVNVWPAWSPDGNQIAFVSYRNGESDIYIISRDGKSIYRVTNDSGIEAMVDWTAE